MGWNPREGPHMSRQVANVGGESHGLRVVLKGSAISEGLYLPTELDTYSGPVVRQFEFGKTLGYLDEAKDCPFVESGDGFEATAPDLKIHAGFIKAYDYEWRRSLSVASAGRILRALEEAHVRVVLWGEVSPGEGQLTMELFAGDQAKASYEEVFEVKNPG